MIIAASCFTPPTLKSSHHIFTAGPSRPYVTVAIVQATGVKIVKVKSARRTHVGAAELAPRKMVIFRVYVLEIVLEIDANTYADGR